MSNLLTPGDAAPDVALADSDGTEISLRSLWQARPLVLLFQRHLG